MVPTADRNLRLMVLFAGALVMLSCSWLYWIMPAQHSCSERPAFASRAPADKLDAPESVAMYLGDPGISMRPAVRPGVYRAAAAGVRCSKLLRGDRNEVAKAEAAVAAGVASGAFEKAANAEDALLVNITCSRLLANGYAREPASDVEASFPLAFGIRFHRRPSQAEILLRTIYAPQNSYCLFVDPAADPLVLAAAKRLSECLPNVHVATPMEKRFVYGSVSPLLADLACMRLLLRLARSGTTGLWQYFINLTGQELPLFTNYELVSLLKLYNGSNDLESEPGDIYKWRYSMSYWCRDSDDQVVKCPAPRAAKPPLPLANTKVYKGLAYGYLSRPFVEFVVREGGMASMLLSWFNDTYSPDENYWATLNRLPDAPGSYVGPNNIPPSARAVSWAGVSPCRGRFVRQVCVFGVGDLPWLLSRHEAFANKFSIDIDPIAVECISELVMERAVNEPHSDSWLVPWYWSFYLKLPQISSRS